MSFTATCSTICLATGPGHFSTALGPSPGATAQSDQCSPGLVRTGPLRSPMNAMAPTRPTELHGCRVQLTAGPAAAAEARSQVRAAICAWEVPIDPSVAVLLTSELVTNSITQETGKLVTLAITCSCDELRVDVHDTSRALPVLVDAPSDAETGRGLMLVATLSSQWGFYPTPAGKAVYFTLAFSSGFPHGAGPGPRGLIRGDGES